MQPRKINLAALGNMVPHLHWHVIPRFADDRHFPSGMGGAATRSRVVRNAPSVTQLRAEIEQVLQHFPVPGRIQERSRTAPASGGGKHKGEQTMNLANPSRPDFANPATCIAWLEGLNPTNVGESHVALVDMLSAARNCRPHRSSILR